MWHKDASDGRARAGRFECHRGVLHTPKFMPVGTRASVKAVSQQQLLDMDTEIILGNTYHLILKPGLEIIEKAGGLHHFMNWQRPILTDSGGYQVFSLAKLRKIEKHGVSFRSHIDGSKMFLGPQEAMHAQKVIGSDIAMVFDECPPWPCTEKEAAESLELTLRWAEECRQQDRAEGQKVFGIVQGSCYPELREESVKALCAMDFDGYAIGGLSVGEPQKEMLAMLDVCEPLMPVDKPRYLMGVGTPPQLVEAVARGVDMFDCVLPTRVGRNGSAYTKAGMLQIKGARFKTDFSPIEDDCGCYACQNFTKAYIRHLLNVGEIFGLQLLSLHNLYFYSRIMREMREAIINQEFADYRQAFIAAYKAPAKS